MSEAAVIADHVPAHVPAELLIDFDIYDNLEPGQDVFERWHDLSLECQRSNRPLLFTPRLGGHWIVTEGAALAELYADTARLLNSSITIPALTEHSKIVPGEADGKEHLYTRRASSRAFTPASVKAMQPKIRALVDALVEEVAPRGECEFISDFALKLPMNLFMSIMELPDEDGPMLRAFSDNVARGATAEIREASRIGLFDYLATVIDERIANPGTDPISVMTKAEYFDGVMPRDKVLAMSVNLLLGGLDTVASFLGFAIKFLSENDVVRRRLATDSAALDACLTELLRRFPLASLARVVAHDFTYRGIQLKQGDRVLLPTMLHGFDDREYAAPLDFRPERQIPTLLTFGRGKHQCLGQFLARYEVREALAGWLARIPEFRVTVPNDKLEVSCGQVNAFVKLPLSWG